MILFAAAFQLKVHWLGKHTLFKPPFGFVMRGLGGVPVARRAPDDLVVELAKAFAENDEFKLVVPVEGKRARAEYWKSGFYRIAQRAGVPIVPTFLDFGQRRGGIGPALWPSGDRRKDMDWIREFYAPMVGKYPEAFGPIRLREEVGAEED